MTRRDPASEAGQLRYDGLDICGAPAFHVQATHHQDNALTQQVLSGSHKLYDSWMAAACEDNEAGLGVKD